MVSFWHATQEHSDFMETGTNPMWSPSLMFCDKYYSHCHCPGGEKVPLGVKDRGLIPQADVPARLPEGHCLVWMREFLGWLHIETQQCPILLWKCPSWSPFSFKIWALSIAIVPLLSIFKGCRVKRKEFAHFVVLLVALLRPDLWGWRPCCCKSSHYTKYSNQMLNAFICSLVILVKNTS